MIGFAIQQAGKGAIYWNHSTLVLHSCCYIATRWAKKKPFKERPFEGVTVFHPMKITGFSGPINCNFPPQSSEIKVTNFKKLHRGYSNWETTSQTSFVPPSAFPGDNDFISIFISISCSFPSVSWTPFSLHQLLRKGLRQTKYTQHSSCS